MRQRGVAKLKGRSDPRASARDRRRTQADHGRPDVVLTEDLEYTNDGKLGISAQGVERIARRVAEIMQGGS